MRKFCCAVVLIVLMLVLAGGNADLAASEEEGYTVSGVVMDKVAEMGIPDMELKIETEDGTVETVTTDKEGRWEKSGLEDEVKITVVAGK